MSGGPTQALGHVLQIAEGNWPGGLGDIWTLGHLDGHLDIVVVVVVVPNGPLGGLWAI